MGLSYAQGVVRLNVSPHNPPGSQAEEKRNASWYLNEPPENEAEWKKSIPKGPCCIIPPTYCFFEITKLEKWRDECLLAVKEEVGERKLMWLEQGNRRDSCADGNVLYPNPANVTMLVALYRPVVLQDVTIGEWVKHTQKLSRVCFTNACILK